MEFTAALSAVTNGINIMKALRGIEKNYDLAQLHAQIADTLNALSDAKISLIDAREALAEKDKVIAGLRSEFENRAALLVGPDDYKYLADDNGHHVGCPICPGCEATSQRVVQMKPVRLTRAKCPVCKEEFSPVTIFLPFVEGGPRTKAQEARINSEQATLRMARNPSRAW